MGVVRTESRDSFSVGTRVSSEACEGPGMHYQKPLIALHVTTNRTTAPSFLSVSPLGWTQINDRIEFPHDGVTSYQFSRGNFVRA